MTYYRVARIVNTFWFGVNPAAKTPLPILILSRGALQVAKPLYFFEADSNSQPLASVQAARGGHS